MERKKAERVEKDLSKFGILDRLSNRTMDLFSIAVQEAFEMTHLPEMLEVLGQEKFTALLGIFEGTTVLRCLGCSRSLKWPPMEDFLEVLRDVDVYARTTAAPRGSKAQVVSNLSHEYNTTPGSIRKSFSRMEARMKRYSSKSIEY